MNTIIREKRTKILIDKIKQGFFSGNQLKIFALIVMTFDHVGAHILDNYIPFRIIGRLSFPIFAYMIAEGCHYTKHKLKYLLTIFSLGTVCQVFYTLHFGKWNMNIFMTFTLSILIIYALDFAKESRDYLVWCVPMVMVVFALFVTSVLPDVYQGTSFHIDYGFFGVMLPVMVSLSDKKLFKILLFTIGLCFLCIDLEPIQWWSILTVIPISLYTGKRGKLKIKYLFYVYYPAHLLVIYGISELIK